MNGIQLSGVTSVLISAVSLLIAARMLRLIAPGADSSRRVLQFTGWIVLAVGTMGACLLIGLGPGMLAWPVVAVLWVRAARNMVATQRRNLFGTLVLAVNKQMPLAPAAAAFADEQEGGFASRAMALSRKLEQGATLVQSIQALPSAFPPEALLAADLGATTGDLGGAFEAVRASETFDRTLIRPILLRLFYVLPALLVFMLFMKILIEPSFVKIYADFDMELPALTSVVVSGLQRPVMSSQGWFANLGQALLMGSGEMIVMIGTLLMMAFLALAVWAWLEWRGVMPARLPILKRILNWTDSALVLRVLALASRRKVPFVGPMVAVANFHPKNSVADRARYAVYDMNNGHPWVDSLRRRGLLSRPDAALLTAAERNGNLPWAMEELADSLDRRATYRMQALAQVVMPLAMLPIGLYLGIVAVAYFLPLVKLITELSS